MSVLVDEQGLAAGNAATHIGGQAQRRLAATLEPGRERAEPTVDCAEAADLPVDLVVSCTLRTGCRRVSGGAVEVLQVHMGAPGAAQMEPLRAVRAGEAHAATPHTSSTCVDGSRPRCLAAHTTDAASVAIRPVDRRRHPRHWVSNHGIPSRGARETITTPCLTSFTAITTHRPWSA